MTLPLALIIEDDPNLGTIFETAMQNAGFDTALDPDGNRYRRIISDRTPALVILDLHLPFAHGRQILASLRADPQTAHLPILVVTADLYLARDLQTTTREHVIMKPVSPLHLMKVAQALLQTTGDHNHER
jgi:DNA-binding response OmpR family regulator